MGIVSSSSWRLKHVFFFAPILLLFTAAVPAQPRHKYPVRGAVSAQDFSKLTSPATASTTAADRVCARYKAGSTVSNPPVLESQNGALEVTIGFYAVTDSQGLVRYCYVTNNGIEAPTLVVDPSDNLTGTGQVQLTVNTTPADPASSKLNHRPGWLAAGGGASLACIVLLILPRRRGSKTALSAFAILAIAFTVIGCGSGSARTDPGTATGTYVVVVSGTAGTGSSQYQTSVNVPITIQ